MQQDSQNCRDTQEQPAGEAGEIGMPQALRAQRLDRDAQALLRWFNLAPRLYEQTSLRTQREIWRLTAFAMGQRPPVASVTTHTIDGPAGPIEMRVFSARPSDQPRPAFLWCHGGGFLVGGLDTADSICRTIARDVDCVAIAVRYRLAPEHELTAGREDFLAALEWVAKNGATLGIDTSRLAIGGDSAGGNICAAVAQGARSRGLNLCLQVLAYPATDLEAAFPSLTENERGFLIDARMLDKIKATIDTKLDGSDPWLSPRRSPDLSGLPPAIIISAGFDPIRDDGLDYGARLRRAGVPVQLVHYAGQFHGFLNFDSVIGAGHDALAQIGAALTAAFRGDPAANRTIEIADPTALAAPLMLRTAKEFAATTLLGWATAERLGLTLLGRLSATVGNATLLLLASSLVPGAFLYRSIANVDRPHARQTFPAALGEDDPPAGFSNGAAPRPAANRQGEIT
jgi:acetyl esterase